MSITLETTDLFKGAFLLCMGGSLANIRVEYNGRRTAIFLITGTDLDRYNTDYETGKARVNPTQLKNALNHLRDLLFNTLREKENKNNDRTETNRFYKNTNRDYQLNRIQRY